MWGENLYHGQYINSKYVRFLDLIEYSSHFFTLNAVIFKFWRARVERFLNSCEFVLIFAENLEVLGTIRKSLNLNLWFSFLIWNRRIKFRINLSFNLKINFVIFDRFLPTEFVYKIDAGQFCEFFLDESTEKSRMLKIYLKIRVEFVRNNNITRIATLKISIYSSSLQNCRETSEFR